MKSKTSFSFSASVAAGVLVLILGVSSCANQSIDPALEPDTILINGKIITVDAEDNIAEALAIKDKKIIAVGTTGEIQQLAGAKTRIIDLKGLSVTPGLMDSHIHFQGLNLLYVLDLNYPKVSKIPDMVSIVQEKVKTLKTGEWIVGAGWDEGKIEELRYVYAKDIDQVTQNNPGWFAPGMGHYGLANSYALKLANITKDTPDPPGGKIDRYPDGTPTGILKETAQGLVTRLIPPYSKDQIKEGIVKLVEEFNRNGMTAAKDGGIGPAKWNLYQELLAEDKLNVRMFVLWHVGKTDNLTVARRLRDRVVSFTKPYISTGDDRLISGGIKLFIDGSGGGRTAWVYDEWHKNFTDIDSGNYGYPAINPDKFQEMVKIFHDAGLHISVHAIGDRAIDWTVDTYDKVLQENPISGLRHGIIHCNIPTDHAIEKIAELQKNFDAAIPELQAPFMWDIGDSYAGNFGPERCLRFMPFKTYVEKGIIWGGGSDWNVTPFEAMSGIWATMTRRPMAGSYGEQPFGTEQCGDVRSALRSYSIWNARQLFLEDKIGSLEVGKYADIAVWDKDLYSVPTDDIKDITCQMTFIGGKIVFTKKGSPIEISQKK